jgi:hypothetical protein
MTYQNNRSQALSQRNALPQSSHLQAEYSEILDSYMFKQKAKKVKLSLYLIN